MREGCTNRPECNECGAVCPSRAIRRFTVGEKKNHVMGIALINIEHFHLKEGREYNQCRFCCAYDALEMKAEGPLSTLLPQWKKSQSVGFGACQEVCPPRVIIIRPALPA
jgi:ferredoxin